MRASSKLRLLLVCGFVLTAAVVLVSQASATGRVRGTGNYGQLSSHGGGTVPIGGTGGNILSGALYQCQYDGTPCYVDLTNTDPNLDATMSGSDSCRNLSSAVDSGGNSLTGAAPCYDLFVAINSGTTFNAGSTVSITIPGFSDPTDQFGVFTCDGGGNQDFGSFCTPSPASPPPNLLTGCEAALQNQQPSSKGTVNIPSACLVAGFTFYFDETANNGPVTATYTPGTVATPEPNSFMLLGAGLASLFFLTKRLRA